MAVARASSDWARKPAPPLLGPVSTAPDMIRAPGVAPNPFVKPSSLAPAVRAPQPTSTPAAPISSGYVGGGGGGSGAAAAAAPATPVPPPMSFDDFVAGDFGYNQTRNEGQRREQDFQAETLRGRQQTEAEQALRRSALQQSLSQMGGDWANDSANRGLLRSGLYLQGQDKVDQQGVRGNQGIDQMLTDFIQQRQSEEVGLQQQNRNALNDVLSQLTQRFNSGLAIQ